MREPSTPEESPRPGSLNEVLSPGSPSLNDLCHEAAQHDGSPFGGMLGEVLVRELAGRLLDLHWFRTDWQRGGALTGYAVWRDDQGADHPAVVKLPVAPRERRWLMRLDGHGVTPQLYAHGDQLDGYDIAWVVMERLQHGPLSAAWEGQEFDLLIEAAGRFYAAAEPTPLDGEPMRKPWDKILAQARKNVREHDVRHGQRWNNALKKAQKKLKKWLDVWENRPIDHWCHGDLHFGNAMTRAAPPDGPAFLFDLAEVRPGHWVEDGVYLEHLFWARRDRLDGRKLCKQLAQHRKSLGLPVDDGWPRLASIKRALLAMSTPAMLDHVGDPPHLDAALDVLETEVGA